MNNMSAKCLLVCSAVLLYGLPFIVSAADKSAPFATMIDAIGIRTNQTHTNNSWEDVAKIKGIEWKWSIYESGAHDSTMEGTTKIGTSSNPNVGITEVKVEGFRTSISKIHVEISNEPHYTTVDDLFGEGDIKEIPTSCDIDGASASSIVYEYIKSGYNPLYIHLETGFGASGESGSVVVTVANRLEDALNRVRSGIRHFHGSLIPVPRTRLVTPSPELPE